MRGKRSLKPEEIRSGISIWISLEVSKILSQALSDIIGDNIEVPGGKWKVIRVDRHSDEVVQHLSTLYGNILNTPATIVSITRSDWKNPHKLKEFDLILNIHGHIVLAGDILLEDAIRPYFENVQELIELNKYRRDCASCGEPLYIPVNNVHICKECEDELNLPF